jgi:hypothetical protein
MVLGSGAMCLGRIVMMLGGFKVCIFWHIHSPCPEFPFWTPKRLQYTPSRHPL